MRFINKTKEIVWFKTPLIRLALYLRDKRFNHVTEHRWIRKVLFSPANLPGYDMFNFYMNERMANFIVETMATERALATLFKRRYSNSNITEGCQHDGRWLKECAASYLDLPHDWEERRKQSSKYKVWVQEQTEVIKRVLH